MRLVILKKIKLRRAKVTAASYFFGSVRNGIVLRTRCEIIKRYEAGRHILQLYQKYLFLYLLQ